jgi:shikimate dehydrogenase
MLYMTFAIDTYAVMGNPISHSLSPLIHQVFAKQTGQQLEYVALKVPLDGFTEAVTQFKIKGGKGLNITVPFKQQAFALATDCTERATVAQAVNTLIIQADGGLRGDNTDGIGLIRDISLHQQESLQGKRILVLGAGGAVRGILASLLAEKPALVVIANRTELTAIDLVNSFRKLGNIKGCGLKAILEPPFDLIINGTSTSLLQQTLALQEGLLAVGGWCYDLAYSSEATPFLRWAKQQGAAKYVDGLGMLVEQAAEAFYLWRGIRPDTLPVLQLLRARK